MNTSLLRQCMSELVGTFILVLLGTGAVHAAVLAGAPSGQVAAAWGVAVALAIYATGAISGAHINPAVTLAMAAFRKFPPARIAPYVLSQLAGAFAAAAILYSLYAGVLNQFEAAHHITRGQTGSELSAMVYGEYFPNPTAVGEGREIKSAEAVSLGGAMTAEGLGTAMLAFFVFALTDRPSSGQGKSGAPVLPALLIGLAVAIIIWFIAPLTQAGLNPARDFGPRLFAWFAGWGSVAIPGPRGGFFTVYILSPFIGALVGAAAYQFLLHPAMRQVAQRSNVEQQGES